MNNLPRATNDHSPMVLYLLNSPVVVSPFRFFNYLQEVDGFQKVLIQAWKAKMSGSPLFMLTRKMHGLKMALKQWRRDSIQDPKLKISHFRERLTETHHQLSSYPLNLSLHKKELVLQDELGSWLAHE